MKNVHVIDHPLVQDSLTHLRSKATSLDVFRFHSDKICQLLFIEAMRGMSSAQRKIETPLAKMTSPILTDDVLVVTVLRAGLAMLSGALQLLPKVRVGFIGLARNEKTAVAEEYYWKLPKITPASVVVVTDPMLATGGSMIHLLKRVQKEKPKKIVAVCVIAAPEGIAAVQKEFPKVEVFTASIDSHLNDVKYIVPGLGDYGDRYFGTTE